MQQTLVVIPRNCTGCRTCELACSMIKSVDGIFGTPRIRIFTTGQDAYMQMTCLHCVEAACVKVCPAKALTRNRKTRAVEVQARRCVGCGWCEVACPFGHIQLNAELGLALKCDLCGGKPACVRFCPHGALVLR